MLISPNEDLQKNTLAALSGTLAKLEYVANLRQGGGDYRHWGLARKHGETSADTVLSEAHCALFSDVLRTPIQQLWSELAKMSAQRGFPPSDFLSQLRDKTPSLLPRDLRGGTARHFNSVLETLWTL